jgi:ATP-dependent Lhr-like helicase
MLSRIKGRIVHQRLERVSPLAVPIMLEIGREPVFGEAQTDIMAEAAEELLREATGGGGLADGDGHPAGKATAGRRAGLG